MSTVPHLTPVQKGAVARLADEGTPWLTIESPNAEMVRCCRKLVVLGLALESGRNSRRFRLTEAGRKLPSAQPDLSETEQNALRIVLMMDKEGKPTFVPASLAIALERRGLVKVDREPSWHLRSLGLEHVVTITDEGRAAYAAKRGSGHCLDTSLHCYGVMCSCKCGGCQS